MRHRTVLIVLAMAGAAPAVAPAPAAAPPAPLFAAADRCLACHNGMTTPSGEDVSIGFAWRASIMANAARDPYWQAAVRRETVDHRDAGPRIEDECAACHMPMARFQARAAGRQGEIFTHLADPLAIDGVSCSLCHQLQNGGPGLEHDGDFRIDTARPWGDRLVYGPYDIPQPRTKDQAGTLGGFLGPPATTPLGKAQLRQRVMHSATGFRPVGAANVETSELCSTCHTLYTTPLDAVADKGIAPFPEQVPYLEWRASAYAGEKTCQACHMTFTAEAVPASSVLGEPRRRFARHGFQGANFFMLGMLARYASELRVAALPQELTSSRQRTLQLLEAESASLSIARAELRDGRLEVEVAVTNTAGHKLPTAYPSRRVWLRFIVTDAGGRRLFVSGELRPDGSIVGNDNDRDPLAFEPHHRVIDAPDQVQIYESILGDAGGRVTTGLLAAVRYLKDNRLLPRGFDKRTAPADCAVRGDAVDDPDFQGGGDRVVYRASVPPGAAGPLRLEVELLYQPIAFRWAHNLDRYAAAPEPARFLRYYDAMSSGSATALARASISLNSSR